MRLRLLNEGHSLEELKERISESWAQRQAAFSPAGRFVALSYSGHTGSGMVFDSWELDTAWFTLKGVRGLSFHPLRNILFGQNGELVAAFDCDTRKQLAETIKLPETESQVQWFQLLPDNKRLLVLSDRFHVVDVPPAWITHFAGENGGGQDPR